MHRIKLGRLAVSALLTAFISCEARAASIGAATYTSVADTNPLAYDLTSAGTQDWVVYSDNTPPTTYDHKFGGNSIAMSAPVTVSPCTFEVLGSATVRSKATFTWNDGTTTGTVTSNNVDDCGFRYSGSSTMAAYGVNAETITFIPGDTSSHTIHLYGYFANNLNGSLQFTASLPGVATPSVLNPAAGLGDFDYSVTFQADQATDSLTVIFTFQKSSASTTLMSMGVQAAVMSGTPPGVPVVNWRVVPEATNYPSDDVIMAGVEIGDPNFMNPLPANPATQDCSATFQEAMNLMSAAGGGTVFVPAGHYMFTNSLTIPDEVILRGRWGVPGSNQPVTGTVLDVYANAGTTNAPAFITGSGTECGVRDLAFWYPLQSATNLVAYPFTLANPNGGMQTIENITLFNSYLGLDIADSPFECARGVYGTPLVLGIYIDRGSAVPRLDTVRFSPDFWVQSGLANAPSDSVSTAALTAFMLTNGIGVQISQMAGMYDQNIFVSGYQRGIWMVSSTSGPPDGLGFFNVIATNCLDGLRIDAGSMQAYDSAFSGTSNGVHGVADGSQFYNCAISGGVNSVLCESGAGGNYDMDLQDCALAGPVNVTNNATLQLINSSFAGKGINVILNNGVNQAVIVGGTNAGYANIITNSGAVVGPTVINPNSQAPDLLPNFPTNYLAVRQPWTTNLYVVTNTAFDGGATGNGVTDDTMAIQAAIGAAETNGGGIVFFPAGTYLVTSSLNLSNGVELRGIFGGRHGNSNLGSLIQIATAGGVSNGVAFVTLGNGCGIRGMNFNYPNQYWQTGQQIAYPYMIRCQGATNYLEDCCCGDMYQGVDVNGANQALLDYCFFGGLLNTFTVEGGATDCRIQNCHVKPLEWWLNDAPPTGDAPSIVIGHAQNTFIVGNCTNLTIFSVFNHAAHTLFTQQGGTGQAMMLHGEQLQRGFVFQTNAAAGTFNFIFCSPDVNQQGDGTGEYCWWLQTNFVGTVAPLSAANLNASADYVVRVDNAGGQFIGDDLGTGQARGLWDILTMGKVAINNAQLGENFSLQVPAGGGFACTNSILPAMPDPSQAGVIGCTNSLISGSFIAADANEVPYLPVGLAMNTNNLAPIAVDVFNSPGSTRDPTLRLLNGWHLASGSNFTFHVTDPRFTNGANPNVTFVLEYLEDTDGRLTVAYDSSKGMETGGSYLLSSTNGSWDTKSFSVADARFSGANGVDISVTVSNTTATNCDPVLLYLMVESKNFLGVAPQLPTAQFAGFPLNGARPLAVTFTDQSTGSITNLLWTFGDGQTTNTAAGGVVPHIYTNAGSYTVSLVASGRAGNSTNTQSGYISVNTPPSPQIGSVSVSGGANVVLTGNGGPTNGSYYYSLLSTTNLTLPLANWSVVSTNLFNADGSFSNALPLTPGLPQQFYRLQLP